MVVICHQSINSPIKQAYFTNENGKNGLNFKQNDMYTEIC